MPPRQAASEGMRELLGQWLPCQLCLWCSPRPFFPGATGQIYKQFGLTIAFPSRSLPLPSPSLLPSPPYCCGETRGTTWRTRRVRVFGRAINWFFDRFNWGFECAGYGRSLSFLVRIRVIVLAVFVALLVLTGFIPSYLGFLPTKIKAISSVFKHQRASLNYTNDITSGGNRTAEAAGNASNFCDWWL